MNRLIKIIIVFIVFLSGSFSARYLYGVYANDRVKDINDRAKTAFAVPAGLMTNKIYRDWSADIVGTVTAKEKNRIVIDANGTIVPLRTISSTVIRMPVIALNNIENYRNISMDELVLGDEVEVGVIFPDDGLAEAGNIVIRFERDTLSGTVISIKPDELVLSSDGNNIIVRLSAGVPVKKIAATLKDSEEANLSPAFLSDIRVNDRIYVDVMKRGTNIFEATRLIKRN